MLEPQNGVDAIAIALLILHRIILTNTKIQLLCSDDPAFKQSCDIIDLYDSCRSQLP